jgi:glycosyltransferase involved in cell wall biosynthesis
LSNIKICHVTNLITGKTDGTYTHLKMLFKLLDCKKFDQHLIFQGNDKIKKEASEFGVKIFELPSLDKRFSFHTLFKVYKILKDEKIAIIVAHHIKPYAIIGIVNIFLRRVAIFNYNGIFIESIYRNKIEKLIYHISHIITYLFNSIHVVVVPSVGSKSILTDESILFRDVRVYYNGYNRNNKPGDFDDELDETLKKIKSKGFVVGVVARLERQKRIDRMLSLTKLILEEDESVHIVVFGDGPLESEMIDLTKKMHLEKKVTFLGYVKNMINYYKYFDLLLLTSDWEGFPLAIWEAMYNRIPIVSTDVGGIKEIIEGENCGYVFNKYDVEEGKNFVINLIEDNNLRKQFGYNGRKAIMDKYNEVQFTQFFEQLYTDLLKIN